MRVHPTWKAAQIGKRLIASVMCLSMLATLVPYARAANEEDIASTQTGEIQSAEITITQEQSDALMEKLFGSEFSSVESTDGSYTYQLTQKGSNLLVDEMLGDATPSDNTDTEGVDADGTNTDGTDAEGADVDGTDTNGTDTDGTDAEGADVEGTNTDGTDTEGTDAEGADIDGADVDDTDTDGTDAEGADIDGADVDDTDTDGTDAEGVDAEGTDAEDADVNALPEDYVDDSNEVLYDLLEELSSEPSALADTGSADKKVDLFFVIDSTGSMSGTISSVKENVATFAQYMGKKALHCVSA